MTQPILPFARHQNITHAPLPPPAPPFTRDGQALVIPIYVKTKNEANHGHGNPLAMASYRKRVRRLVQLTLLACPRWDRLPVLVTLTRHGSGTMDAHDGLPMALKSVVDEIAEWLPLPKKKNNRGTFRADDSDPRVTWKYAQAKAKRGISFVVARFEPRSEPREGT